VSTAVKIAEKSESVRLELVNHLFHPFTLQITETETIYNLFSVHIIKHGIARRNPKMIWPFQCTFISVALFSKLIQKREPTLPERVIPTITYVNLGRH
jgi:hypothetical protein